MKKFLLIGAGALVLMALAPADAFAQRGGGYPAADGAGLSRRCDRRRWLSRRRDRRRGLSRRRDRRRGLSWRCHRRWLPRRSDRQGRTWIFGGGGFRGPVVGGGARVAAFRGGGWGWRRGWGGWGWPVAAGLGLGLGWGYYNYPYYSGYYGYSDPCLAWNGYNWINVCY